MKTILGSTHALFENFIRAKIARKRGNNASEVFRRHYDL